jgi:aspartate/methionine/tyrosine aminotransferase
VLDTDSWSYLDDVDAFVGRLDEALSRHRPKLLLFSSPDNPTGGVVPDEAFDAIVARAAHHGCIVAVDYAYREQYFTASRPLHFSVDPDRHDNLVAIHSNSKWCRGLGRRLGWAIAPPRIIDALELVQQAVILCPDTVHQVALARYLGSALDDGSLRDYLEDARRRYARAAEHMSTCVERHLGMRHVAPAGGLYTVIDVETEADAFVHDIVAATGVVFVPGPGFGDTLAHAVRASFGPLVDDLDRIEEGFVRVRDHLASDDG